MTALTLAASRPKAISTWDETGSQYEIYEGGKPVVAFLFKLISQLQFSGTVPMIDVQVYAKWLSR